MNPHPLEKAVPALGDVHLVIEVGAAGGQDTKVLRRLFPDAELACFEPSQQTAYAFLKNWASEIMAETVSIMPVAISDRVGSAVLWVPDGTPGSESLCSIRKPQPAFYQAFPGASSSPRIVGVIRLDNWLRYRTPTPRIDLLLVKANGAQREVLLGAKGGLKKTRAVMVHFHRTPLWAGEASLDELCSLLPEPDWRLEDVTEAPRHGEYALFIRQTPMNPRASYGE